ncbi:Molybdopterin-synthase adenylyltransferase [Allorhodopirellula heiligendammensis]|uniref:Molybdopterin-synthase adenylyltransferase n=1 Tax=Allorhodopirellula heiligendammensis TaxID=2714739 RepID=A0A5C6BF86_9BACT|nr:Molybdopterin-synthase adenylyltransferase [Allorhodopirellula heiligendammensis]
MGGILNTNPDRFDRQASLVPRDRIQEASVTVIGVGAIGRQVALQLASIGVTKLQLIDFDTVERTNVTTQGYRADEVGQAKVTATMLEVERIDPSIEIDYIIDRFRSTHRVGDVVFCCVDSIATRATVWRCLQRRIQLLIDTRMNGETIRLLTAEPSKSRHAYESTLFAQGDAHAGTCTAKSTIYAASIAAGLSVHQLTRWLRDMPLDSDFTFNLLASELNVAGEFTSSIQENTFA